MMDWKPAIVVPEGKKLQRALERYFRRQIEPIVEAWEAIKKMFNQD